MEKHLYQPNKTLLYTLFLATIHTPPASTAKKQYYQNDLYYHINYQSGDSPPYEYKEAEAKSDFFHQSCTPNTIKALLKIEDKPLALFDLSGKPLYPNQDNSLEDSDQPLRKFISLYSGQSPVTTAVLESRDVWTPEGRKDFNTLPESKDSSQKDHPLSLTKSNANPPKFKNSTPKHLFSFLTHLYNRADTPDDTTIPPSPYPLISNDSDHPSTTTAGTNTKTEVPILLAIGTTGSIIIYSLSLHKKKSNQRKTSVRDTIQVSTPNH